MPFYPRIHNHKGGVIASMNEEESKRKGPKKAGRIAKAAVNVTVDTISGTIGSVFKVLGTILLIFLITGLLFACIFAYYVKTCLTPNINLSLEDFKLSESSTIYYQDSSGQWLELVTLAGEQNRIWVDYDQIPWYMEKALVAIEDKRFYQHKGVDWYRTPAPLWRCSPRWRPATAAPPSPSS